MYHVYILHSAKLNRHYIGMTGDTIETRISKHNAAGYGSHRFTANAGDWELKLEIACSSLSQARKIELHIKSMKSKVFIENLIKYPELRKKLWDKYSSN